MERLLISQLLKWKENPRRKPSVLEGARQVGKTWLLKEFGKRYFKDVCYVNFEQSEMLTDIFAGDLSPQGLIDRTVCLPRITIFLRLFGNQLLLVIFCYSRSRFSYFWWFEGLSLGGEVWYNDECEESQSVSRQIYTKVGATFQPFAIRAKRKFQDDQPASLYALLFEGRTTTLIIKQHVLFR